MQKTQIQKGKKTNRQKYRQAKIQTEKQTDRRGRKIGRQEDGKDISTQTQTNTNTQAQLGNRQQQYQIITRSALLTHQNR